ncbi:MAG: TPM domain-containing protein, partial [Bacteroidetes bacterium]
MKFPTVRHCWTAFLLLLASGLSAKEVPPPPDPPRLVNDFVGLLSRTESQALENKLVAYDDSTSTQIAIVIERSLEGDDIFDYSFRLAEAWGIGRKGKDNGILIYIAFEDRQIWIQTGSGAEGFLPDVMAKRIIDNIIVPAFRQQAYFQGLDRATDAIMQLGSGEFEPEGLGKKKISAARVIFFIVLLIVLFILLSRMGGGGGGGYYRGGRYDRGGGWIWWG